MSDKCRFDILRGIIMASLLSAKEKHELLDFITRLEPSMKARTSKMTNIIKLRFLHDGTPQGREYTYFTPVPVAVGDTVAIDNKKQGVVTQIDIPESEIESFRDKMKTIAGIAPAESEDK